jgi:hypothetical protein
VDLYRVDLHNHMPVERSDYRGPLTTTGHDVVRAALAAGLDAMAVSDHYSLDFFESVRRAAEDSGMPLLVLPGAEIRLSWGDDEVHLVALFPPQDPAPRFESLMEAVGFAGRAEHVDALHRVVCEADPVEIARAIEALGGIANVAHADRFFGPYRLLGRPLLARLIEAAPIAAVEFLDLGNASELGEMRSTVAAIQASDSHHVDEIGRRSSVIEAEELTFEGLRSGLAAAARA